MIDPATVCLFIPPGLKKFKLALFERIGVKIKAAGGNVIRDNYDKIGQLPDEMVPIVGCTPEFRGFILDWQRRGRTWIYWDRGYLRRVFATGLPKGADGGYYRWHFCCFQMQRIENVPSDRWEKLIPGNSVDNRRLELNPWHSGDYILVAPAGGSDYARLHGQEDWLSQTMVQIKRYTERRVIVRDKESKVPLADELAGAHALVTHGSIAAVESVVMGCPVFVDQCSAAAPVGLTDLSQIESPAYPDRERWCWSLAYHQFCESELVDGTLWRLIR